MGKWKRGPCRRPSVPCRGGLAERHLSCLLHRICASGRAWQGQSSKIGVESSGTVPIPAASLQPRRTLCREEIFYGSRPSPKITPFAPVKLRLRGPGKPNLTPDLQSSSGHDFPPPAPAKGIHPSGVGAISVLGSSTPTRARAAVPPSQPRAPGAPRWGWPRGGVSGAGGGWGGPVSPVPVSRGGPVRRGAHKHILLSPKPQTLPTLCQAERRRGGDPGVLPAL